MTDSASTALEIRDPDEARDWVLHAMWLQRVSPARAGTVTRALDWAREIAAEGDPLPLVGFVADVGNLCFDHVADPSEKQAVPFVDPGLLLAYEDHVLGKLYADQSFDRASDAVAHYVDRDRGRGLRFLVDRFRERSGMAGVHVNPAVLKSLMQEKPEELLATSWERLVEDGPHPAIPGQLEQLVAAVRNLGDALAPEDVFELEHGTALAEFGQRLALRQVLRAAGVIEARLPSRPAGIRQRRQEVATRILDEDAYPIGGFTSLSNKGTVESLLHSQLAYMETDEAERPDLFEIKFVRDELLYYSRDENAFLRRRRTFLFALYPELAESRVKDASLDWQRIVYVVASLVVAVRRTIEWLGDDSLVFEILFVEENTGPRVTLADERGLLEMILREQVANGTVSFESITVDQVAEHAEERARASTCHLVTCSTRDRVPAVESALLTRCVVSRPELQVGFETDELAVPGEGSEPLESWVVGLERCLEDFVAS